MPIVNSVDIVVHIRLYFCVMLVPLRDAKRQLTPTPNPFTSLYCGSSRNIDMPKIVMQKIAVFVPPRDATSSYYCISRYLCPSARRQRRFAALYCSSSRDSFALFLSLCKTPIVNSVDIVMPKIASFLLHCISTNTVHIPNCTVFCVLLVSSLDANADSLHLLVRLSLLETPTPNPFTSSYYGSSHNICMLKNADFVVYCISTSSTVHYFVLFLSLCETSTPTPFPLLGL